MESLLANYASSDEEGDHQQRGQSLPSKRDAVSSSSSKASSFFSSLPEPKSTSLLSSLPQPKQQTTRIPITPTENSITLAEDEEEKESKKPSFNSKRSSSIFTSLPQPKSKTLDQPPSTVSSSETTAKKKVVQFRPPSMSSNLLIDEDEDEDEEEERPKRKQSEYLNQSSSVKSFLSSIPAPKKSASLGAIPSALGSGRRSIIETEASSSIICSLGANSVSGNNQYVTNNAPYESGSDENATTCANYQASTENYANYEVGEGQSIVDCGSYGYGVDPSTKNTDNSSYVNYDNYNGYGDYGSASMVQGSMGAAQSGVGFPGRRRKNEIPTEIVEVKQDELIKNRPTEDKAKLTGRAFGPSYAPVSTKGKPTKLHKRKHQIGSLFFDMKQKEMELAERRARGFQTKAQTQGKYGW